MGFVFISLFRLRPVRAADFDMTGLKVYIEWDWRRADTWRERCLSAVTEQQTHRLGRQGGGGICTDINEPILNYEVPLSIRRLLND
jgi:hypothetical protein